MKLTAAWSLALRLSIPVALLLQVDAYAQTCEGGCSLQRKACSADALPTMLACRLDCRTNTIPTELGVCMRECSDAFAAEREGCRDDAESCDESCESLDSAESPFDPEAGPDDGPTCVNTCGRGLGTCARDVASATRDCISVCRDGDHRRACFRECAAASKEATKSCGSDFRSCMSDCGAASPVPRCVNTDAPSCGGRCRFSTHACVETEVGICGCVRIEALPPGE